ncbi:unnamed protein product, partial [Rotaria sp. Silwood1]
GLNVVDVDVLTDICDEIELNPSMKRASEKCFRVFNLSLDSTINIRERHTRI